MSMVAFITVAVMTERPRQRLLLSWFEILVLMTLRNWAVNGILAVLMGSKTYRLLTYIGLII